MLGLGLNLDRQSHTAVCSSLQSWSLETADYAKFAWRCEEGEPRGLPLLDRKHRFSAETGSACRDWSTAAGSPDLVRLSQELLNRLDLSRGRFPEFADVAPAWMTFRAPGR